METYTVLYALAVLFTALYFLTKTKKDIDRLRHDPSLEDKHGKPRTGRWEHK